MRLQWYDRRGRPITMARANELLGQPEYVQVAQHEEHGYRVSTVWLGLNRANSDDAPPILFETMIFGPSPVDYCKRYATEPGARAGHTTAIQYLRAHVLDQPTTPDGRKDGNR